MAWSVDRLGRSLRNLVEFLAELHGKHVDLSLHFATSTPGRQGVV
jgi:DNA invertase Pin-like site-specific DNA recombinase